MRRKTLHKPSRRKFSIREMEEEMLLGWNDKFRAAETLGKPDENTVAAQDHAISNSMTLLGHSLDLGQMPSVASFMGYPALQDISQNGLIRACIETVADDMTREFGVVKIKEEDDTDTIQKITGLLDKFSIQKLFHQVAEFVGYYGGCLVFIDTGVDDNTLQLPLNLTSKSDEVGIDKVKGFRIIDPINVFPGDYNSINPLRDDFYKPRFWWVMGKRVHASRLIRFVANEVPQLFKPAYNFLGIAQAQILWDYVIHFGQCREATAELITKQSMTVVKTNMTETLFQKGGTADLDRRMLLMAKYRNNSSCVAIDKEEEDVVNISVPMTGLTDVGRQALEFLACINRTPAVKLLGISPSGFNATGESDIRNYYDHIRSQQEKLFGDGMRVILHCLQLHAFGKVDPSMIFEWNELGDDDEQAIANIQKTKADTVGSYLDRNIISQEEARQFIANDENSGLNIDPDDLPEDDEEGVNNPEEASYNNPVQNKEENENDFPEQRPESISETPVGNGRATRPEGLADERKRSAFPH